MSKYAYAPGLSDADKKKARRQARELARANGTYVPHAVNTDGIMTITADMVKASQGKASQSTATLTRASQPATSEYTVTSLKAYVALLTTGASPARLASLTSPDVLDLYREVIMSLASQDDQDQQDQDPTEVSQDDQPATVGTFGGLLS